MRPRAIKLSDNDPSNPLPTGLSTRTSRGEKDTIDKYGRTVGTIFVDGLDANREQIKAGMAWVYRKYLRDQSLLQVEEEARRAKIGLWSDPNGLFCIKVRNAP